MHASDCVLNRNNITALIQTNNTMEKEFFVTAALDIGTTFSGYAFTLRNSPDTIICNKNWGESDGLQSLKMPTSILITKDGGFVAAGFEAERTYSDPDTDKSSLHLFRNFKMILHKQEDISTKTVVVSVDGTAWPALEIFGHVIHFLSQHMMKAVNNASDSNITATSVLWIVTVPAIWSERSNKFMREAAKLGGIHVSGADNVMLCLEPEAASLCCRRPNIAGYALQEGDLDSGTYVILDCGGGTVDAIAHTIISKNSVKEILPASGGPWGGIYVDRKFHNLLNDIFGKDFINKFINQHPGSWLDIISSFEVAKKAFHGDQNSSIRVRLPWEFTEFFSENFKEVKLTNFIHTDGAKFSNGSLLLNSKVAKEIYLENLNNIVVHIRTLLQTKELHKCKYIFMVGGFSECVLLQNEIKANFETNGLKVLIPSSAQMAVLKGAVLYGHYQSEISTRIARYTYGYVAMPPFNPKIHRKDYVEVDDHGQKRCNHVYNVLVKKGEPLPVGYTVTRITYPVSVDAHTSSLEIYTIDRSPNWPVQYITDPDVQNIGQINIEVPYCKSFNENKMKDIYTFGATELHVHCIHVASGKECKATLDFLSTPSEL